MKCRFPLSKQEDGYRCGQLTSTEYRIEILDAVSDPGVRDKESDNSHGVPGEKGFFLINGRSRLVALMRSARSKQRVAETLYRSRAAGELEVRDKCRYD